MQMNEVVIDMHSSEKHYKSLIKFCRQLCPVLFSYHAIKQDKDIISHLLSNDKGLKTDGTYLAMRLCDNMLYSLYDRIEKNKKIDLKLFNEKVETLNFLTNLSNNDHTAFKVSDNGTVVQVKKGQEHCKALPMLTDDTQKTVKMYISLFYEAQGYTIKYIPK